MAHARHTIKQALSARLALAVACVLTMSGCGDGVSGLLLGALPQDRVTPDDEREREVIAPSAEERPRAAAGAPALPEPDPDEWYVSLCSPVIIFENTDLEETGQRAAALIEDPTSLMHTATQSVCRAFYREPDEVPSIETLHFTLENFDGLGDISEKNLRLSTRYLTNFENANGGTREEAIGVAIYLLAHMYQNLLPETPHWMISGKADVARLLSGYLPEEPLVQGDSWEAGSQVTAYFFAWIDKKHPGFVYKLNQRMKPENGNYSDELFDELTGTPLPILWDAYRTSF